MKLFSYGTLMRGLHNNYLLASATFLREDTIKGTLYTSDPNGRGIPFLLPGEGVVHGELFDVPNELFHRLDALEGHPSWYTRELRQLDSGQEAYVYAYNHPEQLKHLHLLSSGVYGAKTLPGKAPSDSKMP